MDNGELSRKVRYYFELRNVTTLCLEFAFSLITRSRYDIDGRRTLRNFTLDFHPVIVSSDFDIKRGKNQSHRSFHALKAIVLRDDVFPGAGNRFPMPRNAARAASL